MKKVTLQLQNINGEIEEEKEVVIGDNDILVMQYHENMTLQNAHKAFGIIEKGMETGGLVGIPSGITFTVIKKMK